MSQHKKARFRVIAVLAIVLAAVCLGIIFGPNLKFPKGSTPSGSTPAVSTAPTGGAPANSPEPTQGEPTEGTPDDEYIEPSPHPVIGETKRYSYLNLEIELTNVKSDRTETIKDDGDNDWQYTVVTLYPGAALSVLSADMSDPAYTEDGLPHPQWGILIDPYDRYKRIELTDDLQPVEMTPEMIGVFNFEASLFVFRFEFAEEQQEH